MGWIQVASGSSEAGSRLIVERRQFKLDAPKTAGGHLMVKTKAYRWSIEATDGSTIADGRTHGRSAIEEAARVNGITALSWWDLGPPDELPA